VISLYFSRGTLVRTPTWTGEPTQTTSCLLEHEPTVGSTARRLRSTHGTPHVPIQQIRSTRTEALPIHTRARATPSDRQPRSQPTMPRRCARARGAPRGTCAHSHSLQLTLMRSPSSCTTHTRASSLTLTRERTRTLKRAPTGRPHSREPPERRRRIMRKRLTKSR